MFTEMNSNKKKRNKKNDKDSIYGLNKDCVLVPQYLADCSLNKIKKIFIQKLSSNSDFFLFLFDNVII